jgi:hypothetical protein
MPQTLEGTLPGVPLTDGQQIVLEARDPTSGAAVTGVKVSNIAIYGLDLTAGTDASLAGPFQWVSGPTDTGTPV